MHDQILCLMLPVQDQARAMGRYFQLALFLGNEFCRQYGVLELKHPGSTFLKHGKLLVC